jgi:hypothetical protein
MTTNQVEAVARALHAAVPHMAWEDLKPWDIAEYRRKARVAIAAYEDARTPISGTKAAGKAGTATHAWARIRTARNQSTEGEEA